MSAGDFFEWLTVLVAAPLATLAMFFRAVTALFVYMDAAERSKSRFLAVLLAVAVAWFYWPISFLAYLVGTALLDRRPRTTPAV